MLPVSCTHLPSRSESQHLCAALQSLHISLSLFHHCSYLFLYITCGAETRVTCGTQMQACEGFTSLHPVWFAIPLLLSVGYFSQLLQLELVILEGCHGRLID